MSFAFSRLWFGSKSQIFGLTHVNLRYKQVTQNSWLFIPWIPESRVLNNWWCVMNFQWMPLGGLFWFAAQREAGTESKGEGCKSLNEIFNKSSFECMPFSNHCIWPFFESRHNWSREWTLRMQKDSPIKEKGTAGNKWRPESRFKPGSGNFPGGQFSLRVWGHLSFSSLTLKSKSVW